MLHYECHVYMQSRHQRIYDACIIERHFQENSRQADLPSAEIKADTRAGPNPLPRSSVMLCHARETPLVSGSFTFSSIALLSGPAVLDSIPPVTANSRVKKIGVVSRLALVSHHIGRVAEATVMPVNKGIEALLTLL